VSISVDTHIIFVLGRKIMNDTSNYTTKNVEAKKEPFVRRFMDAFGTVFALNICFVIGCLPVITIGASITALYAMCIRIQEDEEETVVSGFIHEFKRSFKQSTLAFLAILLALFVMFFEFLLVKKTTGFISNFYTGVLYVEVVFLALAIPFLFPLIARFNNKVGVSIRNSLILAVSYLGSWIKILVAWVAPIFLSIRYPIIFIYTWYLWLLLIFGIIAYGTSGTVRKVFALNTKRMEDAARKKEEAEREEAEEIEAENTEAEDAETVKAEIEETEIEETEIEETEIEETEKALQEEKK